MFPSINAQSWRVKMVAVLFGAWLASSAALSAEVLPPARDGAKAEDSDVRLVVIMSRHGVRPPIATNESLAKYAAQPWPSWEIRPGYLTPHGAQLMSFMGAYYRAVYVRDGLLTGRPAEDMPLMVFRADSDQRTIESARSLGAGLLPGGGPAIEARPIGQPDPLFTPVKSHIGHPDVALAKAAILGRMGGNPASIMEAGRPALSALQRVLFGETGAVPAGKTSLFAMPITLGEPSAGSDLTIDLGGFLHTASSLTEDFILEYADGKPMQDVGWGRVTRQTLTELLQLHSLYWDLGQRTFYIAQVQSSNLASHILQTLDQAATGREEPGAFAPPSAHMVVVVGHDTNIANLGGLMGVNWWQPGSQMNPVLPGGAMVFELRQSRGDGRYFVRLYYASQSLDQMRNGDPLSLEDPPDIAPIFIPACSQSGPGYDAPFDKFKALLQRVIDPEFVVPGSS